MSAEAQGGGRKAAPALMTAVRAAMERYGDHPDAGYFREQLLKAASVDTPERVALAVAWERLHTLLENPALPQDERHDTAVALHCVTAALLGDATPRREDAAPTVPHLTVYFDEGRDEGTGRYCADVEPDGAFGHRFVTPEELGAFVAAWVRP